jgi:hypothetical protein
LAPLRPLQSKHYACVGSAPAVENQSIISGAMIDVRDRRFDHNIELFIAIPGLTST